MFLQYRWGRGDLANRIAQDHLLSCIAVICILEFLALKLNQQGHYEVKQLEYGSVMCIVLPLTISFYLTVQHPDSLLGITLFSLLVYIALVGPFVL